ESQSGWLIEGSIDICDPEGNYYDSFEITILVPDTYPHCIPTVREISDKLDKRGNWHFNRDESCCLDIYHRLLREGKPGIHILTFVKDKVYPYFANQVYRLKEGKYANGEFMHNEMGNIQFYLEDLKFPSLFIATKTLSLILDRKRIINKKCFCGSTRSLKKCHISTYYFLASLPRIILIDDFMTFWKILIKTDNPIDKSLFDQMGSLYYSLMR
ncbi:MAG: hypothetical protein WBH03_08705, partial [Cyclobacteriaceae bacterium]